MEKTYVVQINFKSPPTFDQVIGVMHAMRELRNASMATLACPVRVAGTVISVTCEDRAESRRLIWHLGGFAPTAEDEREAAEMNREPWSRDPSMNNVGIGGLCLRAHEALMHHRVIPAINKVTRIIRGG